VSLAVATMSEVSQSAARIADIIGVIDGIAFQTNILALNAAVEARARRRAGPRLRGRGFRGAQPRAEERAGRQGDQRPHQRSVAKAQDGTRQVEQAGRPSRRWWPT
jgi:hypothetical protein